MKLVWVTLAAYIPLQQTNGSDLSDDNQSCPKIELATREEEDRSRLSAVVAERDGCFRRRSSSGGDAVV